MYVLGDFNARLGRKTGLDVKCGYSDYMGSFGKGARNDNGEALLGFMTINGLFAANTCFKHSSRHVTTHTGYVKDWSAGRALKKTKPYYNQLDYILCKSNPLTGIPVTLCSEPPDTKPSCLRILHATRN